MFLNVFRALKNAQAKMRGPPHPSSQQQQQPHPSRQPKKDDEVIRRINYFENDAIAKLASRKNAFTKKIKSTNSLQEKKLNVMLTQRINT